LENLQQALLGKSSFSVVWKNITQLFAHFKLLLSGDIKLMASENGA